MKALLLAAGRGTRISRYLGNRPKCTVDIGNGKPLIEYTVEMLRAKGIKDIAIVTGYRHGDIESLFADTDVKIYYSPFFDITNSIVSAWFAREFIADDDILIMNADVFCEEALYDVMLGVESDHVMFYDTRRIDAADYRFFCEDGVIKKYGKELAAEETSGEYVGIARMSKRFLPAFRERLDLLIDTQNSGLWWENVLYSMTDRIEITAHDVAPHFWAEVDYIEDYSRIIGYVRRNGL